MFCGRGAGSGLPLPRLRPLFGVEFRLNFRVRHRNQSPHEVCELAKVTCRILRGTLRVIRHSNPSGNEGNAVVCASQYAFREIGAPMFLGYMDDSKRFDKKKESFEVLSVVLVHDKLFHQIESLVGLCVEGLVPEEKLHKFEEFHACELYGGYGVFDGIDQELRFATIRQLLLMLKDYKIPVIYGAVNVPQFERQPYGSALPIDVAFRLCIPAISDLMQKERQERSLEYALLIADDTDKDKRTSIKKSFRQLRRQLRPPNWDAGIWYLHDDMYFGSSKDSIGIQLADLCSYFIAKHLEKTDENAEVFYQMFRENIVFSKVEPSV